MALHTRSGRRIRVLVVDDSAFARKVIREVLEASRELEVVDIARDGLEALEKIAALEPDVVTLDLVMPELDGLGVLRALGESRQPPRVVVVSMSDAESALGLEALQAGALDVVHKPTALATERLYELGAELRAKVLAAAGARAPRALERPSPAAVQPSVFSRHEVGLVVIGTSTGGPQALTRLLTALPGDLPVPVVVALHIPEGYTQGLAARLDGSAALQVCEASEGAVLRPGQALIAPGGRHLRLVGGGLSGGGPGQGGLALAGQPVVHLSREAPPGRTAPLHVPSVDLLFESAAALLGRRVLAVVLTGMGEDGLLGARRVREAGGTVLVEAESSCVVYGMPRAVSEAGLASARAPLDQMADLILRHL